MTFQMFPDVRDGGGEGESGGHHPQNIIRDPAEWIQRDETCSRATDVHQDERSTVEGREEKKGSPGGGELGDAMPSQTSEGDPRSLEEKNEIGWRELRCDRASRKVSVYFFDGFEVSTSRRIVFKGIYTSIY